MKGLRQPRLHYAGSWSRDCLNPDIHYLIKELCNNYSSCKSCQIYVFIRSESLKIKKAGGNPTAF